VPLGVLAQARVVGLVEQWQVYLGQVRDPYFERAVGPCMLDTPRPAALPCPGVSTR
jgi:hypothetical protein